jgi:hypothetical protein
MSCVETRTKTRLKENEWFEFTLFLGKDHIVGNHTP